jgi:hypothetical protein
MFDNPDAAPDPHTAPAETRAERRMRRLEEMSELGLSIGRKLERQAELAAAHAEVGRLSDRTDHTQSRRVDEIARAFAKVLRAVALATAIEDRIDRGLPALPDIERNARLRDQAARDRRAAAASAVECAIHADPTIRSPRRLADLKINLERLLDREVMNLDAFLGRPLPEIVAKLRQDLGLEAEEEVGLWEDETPSPLRNPSPVRGRIKNHPPRFGTPPVPANSHAGIAPTFESSQTGPLSPPSAHGTAAPS